MRVVIDVNSVVPHYVQGWTTGIGRTTKALVEAMDKLENLPFEVMLYSQNMKGIGGRNLDTHFPTRHLYLPHRDNFNRFLGKVPVRELLTDYDLYHIPHNFDYVRHPERTIITLHDTFYFACPEDNLNHQFARDHYPQLARQCRGILTCSEASKRDIVNYMDVDPDKIHVTPWGVDHQLFRPSTDQAVQPYFLAVSCSAGRKNTLNVVRAYQLLAQHDPSHRLILVWGNPSQEVLQIVNRPEMQGKVEILANISDEKLVELYQQATCTFFPSRYEGFGLPVLESMACGTPVVTCNNSSLPEVGGEAALYVDPDDIEAMASYMEQFENGTLKKSDLSPNCLTQASKFTWHSCAEKTAAAMAAMAEE